MEHAYAHITGIIHAHEILDTFVITTGPNSLPQKQSIRRTKKSVLQKVQSKKVIVQSSLIDDVGVCPALACRDMADGVRGTIVVRFTDELFLESE